jgi:hypothetical protein
MRRHFLFVAGLIGLLLANAFVIRYCWANPETARPPVRHVKPVKPSALALEE